MELPAGFTCRRATLDDVQDVLALIVAVDCEEYGEPDYEEADVREDWARPRLDLDRDTWLVHDDTDRLVGYAIAWDKSPHELVMGETYVQPDAPDLYPWLVAAISGRAAEHATESGRAVAHLFNGEPNRRRAAALTEAGYVLCRVFRRMVIDLDTPPPLPSPGPGVVIRRVTPEDLPVCWEVQRESFARHFDYVPEPYDAWYRRQVESETYRPDLWWLAEVDGVPAGVLIGQRHEEDGWIKSLGTLPAARGRGAGTALLLTAFAAFREAGVPKVGLGVDSDNSTGAMALYERVGMRAEQRYDCYEKIVQKTSAIASHAAAPTTGQATS